MFGRLKHNITHSYLSDFAGWGVDRRQRLPVKNSSFSDTRASLFSPWNHLSATRRFLSGFTFLWKYGEPRDWHSRTTKSAARLIYVGNLSLTVLHVTAGLALLTLLCDTWASIHFTQRLNFKDIGCGHQKLNERNPDFILCFSFCRNLTVSWCVCADKVALP